MYSYVTNLRGCDEEGQIFNENRVFHWTFAPYLCKTLPQFLDLLTCCYDVLENWPIKVESGLVDLHW